LGPDKTGRNGMACGLYYKMDKGMHVAKNWFLEGKANQRTRRQSGECLVHKWTFLDSFTVSWSGVVSVCIQVLPTPWSGVRVHSIPGVCIYVHICVYVSLRWTKGDGFMNIFVKIFSKSYCEISDLGQEALVHLCSILGRSNFIPRPSPHSRRPLIGWGHAG
jgi:hypothetical protein